MWNISFIGLTLKSLLTENPSKRFIAQNGGNSHKHRILGEPGADVTIPVPVGVTVVNDFGQVLGKNENTYVEQDLFSKCLTMLFYVWHLHSGHVKTFLHWNILYIILWPLLTWYFMYLPPTHYWLQWNCRKVYFMITLFILLQMTNFACLYNFSN